MSRLRVAAVRAFTKEGDLIEVHQKNDELCQNIIKYLQDKDKDGTTQERNLSIWQKEIDFFEIHDGILYRRVPYRKDWSRRHYLERIQTVLPLSLREKVLRAMHDDPLSGHLAFLRTYFKVNNYYYWPDMRNDIKRYCESCLICAANTKSGKKSSSTPT